MSGNQNYEAEKPSSLSGVLVGSAPGLKNSELPIVSIAVPFLGLPFGILNIELVKPKKGTTMETIVEGSEVSSFWTF